MGTRSPHPPGGPAPRPKRILLVDDVPELCEALRDCLAGLRGVFLAIDVESEGVRALRRVRAEPYDVVLCDTNIPHVDGFQILAAARARHPAGLRILMSAYPNPPGREADRSAAGVDGYLRKPVRAMEFRHLFLELLQAAQDRVARWRDGSEASPLHRVERAPGEISDARFGDPGSASGS